MGLDTVELVLGLEVSFGINISDAEAERMPTTRHWVEHVYTRVRSTEPEDHGCLSIRAFNGLRTAFLAEGVSRSMVYPGAQVTSLVPRRQRRDILSTVCQRASLRPLRRLPLGLQFTFGRVRDVVLDAVIGQHGSLRLPGHGWSRVQVREVVRAVIYVQFALRGFSDDAEFMKELI